ncbi:MAG: TIGR00282 family metallophosphoesterase [Candidatus Tectomicrobia bacterium]|nr:TIGR00282 family metallophosphoesterase [Candidatus Tectomicrobia bacterium]
MRILFVGDVNGKTGRRMAAARLPLLRRERGVDLCVVNGENAAGGFGITGEMADELFRAGADVITSGNHIWNRKETADLLLHEPRLLRPSNYPPGAPGKGMFVAPTPHGPAAVINLMGRVFMPPVECPFREADRLLGELPPEVRIVLVDIHAEATSEKVALGWHLDGRVSAVLGTHTHVQTADERVLPKGTAYLSDAGMTGPADSVIGIKTSIAVRKFLTGVPVRLEAADGPAQLNGALIEVEPSSGRATSIERIIFREAGQG